MRPSESLIARLVIGMAALGCVIAAITLFFAIPGCTPRPTPIQASTAPVVRVRLLAGVDRCTIAATTPPTFTTDNGHSSRELGLSGGQSAVVTLVGSNWSINGANAGSGILQIDPQTDGSITLDGTDGPVTLRKAAYHGAYRFVPLSNGKFDVVNVVDIELYLQGVLAKELLPDWQNEAYKAQAVIARTYALYEMKTLPAARHWDLNPDERSQVYGGINGETPRAIDAVQSTRGMVVTYGPGGQEKIFKTYFSSCCGGVTNSASDVFNEVPSRPLQAIYNGATCAIATRYSWPTVTVAKTELARRIRTWGAKNGRSEANIAVLKSIDIASWNPFGRPQRFVIVDAKDQRYALTAEQMRSAINTDADGVGTVYSGFFKPVNAGDSIQFTDGHGFGHGVGACQWCMQARALGGATFEQIVVLAYPESKVLRAF